MVLDETNVNRALQAHVFSTSSVVFEKAANYEKR